MRPHQNAFCTLVYMIECIMYLCVLNRMQWVLLCTQLASLRLQLHGAIYRPDSFVLMLRYCVNLKAIRYESTSMERIVADKSRV